ncbi:cation-dependent mannose-6-phosphate receptor-like [Ostrea edulis]|uniref:cation-dependent mannose-6-phosphate receptor-like n=1 Tax=Ostrea edulis TaxID=37623 RepID=UPI0024AF6EF9|nr:cation-dependent mannose-6-phosphate receptor-like [Ostrea edulis]XP_048743410.2 cation-dependent mannose-6-phosphate receptor-like [Ostrea edulis]XP_048743421.2 cation-dependent mannose-6-phosphate receptor-like [Ostrea edulis]XP_056004608.1 cation-dependent mannose-6-phosphate receptor-like [Ostrea edulis]
MDYTWILWIMTIHLVDFSLTDCKFPRHKTERNLQQRIQPLVGKTFDGSDGKNEYKYYFGVCTKALDRNDVDAQFTGLLQVKQDKGKSTYKLGKYTDASIISGSDWLILEYLDGDKYHSHCGSEPRRGRVMFNCDNSVSIGEEKLVVLEEENNKTEDCFYLFEMKTSVVCPELITVSLSVGSILIIVFLCILALYLILGCAYMRFVIHAKGKEQCPNYEFWKDFGNLQADGCDLVCRSKRPPDSHSYKGIGDDQLDGEEERDDHLLPM